LVLHIADLVEPAAQRHLIQLIDTQACEDLDRQGKLSRRANWGHSMFRSHHRTSLRCTLEQLDGTSQLDGALHAI